MQCEKCEVRACAKPPPATRTRHVRSPINNQHQTLFQAFASPCARHSGPTTRRAAIEPARCCQREARQAQAAQTNLLAANGHRSRSGSLSAGARGGSGARPLAASDAVSLHGFAELEGLMRPLRFRKLQSNAAWSNDTSCGRSNALKVDGRSLARSLARACAKPSSLGVSGGSRLWSERLSSPPPPDTPWHDVIRTSTKKLDSSASASKPAAACKYSTGKPNG
jgi:hypothetical protein